MRALLLTLGLPDVVLEWLLLLLAIIVLCAIAFGWLSDLVLDDGAFGVFLNAIIGLAAAALGAWAWRRFGMTASEWGQIPIAAVATASATAGLFLAVMTRRQS